MDAANINGLIGIPYCPAEKMGDPLLECDCYALARLAAARFGVSLPADPAEALAGEAGIGSTVEGMPQAGDLLVIRDRDGQHIAVMVDTFRFIHMTVEGSCLGELIAWERLGRIERRVRPRRQA